MGIKIRERKLDALGKLLAIGRERDAVALALKQLGAQLGLELLYRNRKRRLRNEQLSGGSFIAFNLRQRPEIIQLR